VLTPAITVITAIGLDHTHVLGGTVEEIAREKAGIMKPGVPVVIYPQPFTAAYVELLYAAKAVEAPLFAVKDASILVESSGLDGQKYRMEYQGMDMGIFSIPLLGRHQILNTATAALAAMVFGQYSAWPLSLNVIRRGMQKTCWPGRMEIMSKDPLIILDGAHNPQGAGQLAVMLNEFAPNSNAILLVGALRTKDVDQVARELSQSAQLVITTQPPSYKALPAKEVSDAFQAQRMQTIVQADMETALRMGIEMARSRHCPLVIAGSLYLVGAARTWLRQNPTK
jgi:dihydrofolate synthase/folylpolyglutamate synthase